MTTLEKYTVRLEQLNNGAKEFYKGERDNVVLILELGE